MLRPRIIPCLLIHKNGLVKTVQFKDPKYVGDPINAVRIFNEKEADELIVLDIDATVKKSPPNFNLIKKLAAECRMPLCYGGGISSVEDARRVISLGVEKIAISSSALSNPYLLKNISLEIGKQSVVVILDIKKRSFLKSYNVWTHNGTINTKIDVFSAIKTAQDYGAGEIVINFIDHEGTLSGYPIDLIKELKGYVHVPFTVMGGAKDLDDLKRLTECCGLIGMAAGSIFVFKGKYRAVLINYPSNIQKEEMIYGFKYVSR